MDSKLELAKYFERIGYHGVPKCDLQTLRDLHLKHVKTFPFENFNPLLKLPVLLDSKSLIEKMVLHRRGGYCFEQNLLFNHMLGLLGFETIVMPGRVLVDQESNAYSSQTHMLVRIRINGKDYISDVGFGASTLTGPLELDNQSAQKTPHEDYRVVEYKNEYLLEVYLQNRWKLLYRFEPRLWHYIDYKVGNWYTSTHPDSHFTKDLSVAIAGDDSRYTLRNNIFKTYVASSKKETEVIKEVKRFKEILDKTFKITLPKEPSAEKLLEKFIAGNLQNLDK